MAILFNNNFELKVKGIYIETVGGNYLMVYINTMKVDTLLVNIYRPNRDDPNFYANLNEKIAKRDS